MKELMLIIILLDTCNYYSFFFINYRLSIYLKIKFLFDFAFRLPLDPRAKRYIMSFVVDEPFIVDGFEFITLKVKGQSFMMHQIRKMVGLVIGVLRDIVTKEAFEKHAFDAQKYEIVRAPGLGLMLNIVRKKNYVSSSNHKIIKKQILNNLRVI